MSYHLNEPKTELYRYNDDELPQLVISSTCDGAVSASMEKSIEIRIDDSSFEMYYSYDDEDEPSENMPYKKTLIPTSYEEDDTLKKLENLRKKLTGVTITSNASKNILTTSRASNNNNNENTLNQFYYKRSNVQVIDNIKNIDSLPVETVNTIPKVEIKDNFSSELMCDDMSFASSTQMEAYNDTKVEEEEIYEAEEVEEVEEERISEAATENIVIKKPILIQEDFVDIVEDFEEKDANTTSSSSHQESIAIENTSVILNNESSQTINNTLLAKSSPFFTTTDQRLEAVFSEDHSEVTTSTHCYSRWYDSEIIKDMLYEKRLREVEYEERDFKDLTVESSERIDRLYHLGKMKQIQRRIIDRKIHNTQHDGYKTINSKTVNESARLTNLYHLGKNRQMARRVIEQKQKLQQKRSVVKSPNKQDKHDATILAGQRLYNKSKVQQQRGKELREEVRKTREKARYADWFSNLHPAPFVSKI